MQIFGILNVTPDSFSDGSPEILNIDYAVRRALKISADGADIIDIGGESTRPGFEPVSIETECNRVLPVIRALRRELPQQALSIDTRKPEVARRALEAGVSIVNAHGGLDNRAMRSLVEEYACSIVAYHVADVRLFSEEKAVRSVLDFLLRQRAIMEKAGLDPHLLICDPGIGFGKTFEQNLAILRHVIPAVAAARVPIMIGVSRKQHLGHNLKRGLGLYEAPTPSERLEAGLAELAYAHARGATHVRTHDVLATKRFLAAWEYLHA